MRWLIAIAAFVLGLSAAQAQTSAPISLMPTPIQHFVDANGNALVGGKLFSYLASTNTKTPTYTDSTGGTANQNPIILNARGEAQVWLVAGMAYKFVLSPSTDSDPPTNAIWTVDGVTGSTDLQGEGPTVVNHVACWDNTIATLLKDCIPATNAGGTGLTSSGPSGNVLTSDGTKWTSAALPAQTTPQIGTAGRNVSLNDTVLQSDNHNTLVLGGNAFFTETLPAVGGLTVPFAVTLSNQDTGRGKRISVTGGTDFFLWPGQQGLCSIQNGAWVCPQPQRYAKPGVNLYVDQASGNDNNDCLAATTGACETIGAAVLRLYQSIDAQNGSPTININCGTYGESVSAAGQITGVNVFFIQGASPGCVIWRPVGATAALLVGDNAEVEIGNVTFDNVGGVGGAVGLGLHQTAVADILSGVEFGTFGGGTHMECDHTCMLNIDAGYKVSGPASVHISMGPQSYLNQMGSTTVTILGDPVIVIWFQIINGTAGLASGITYSGATTNTGQQWAVIGNGFLSLSGNTVPGVTPGSPVPGTSPYGGQVQP